MTIHLYFMERLDKCARKNKKEKHNIPINQELSEILAKYYDGSFDRHPRFRHVGRRTGGVGGSCEENIYNKKCKRIYVYQRNNYLCMKTKPML